MFLEVVSASNLSLVLNNRISARRREFMQLGQHFFFHYNLAIVVKLSFMPVSSMRKVMFTSRCAHSQLLGMSLIMRSSFISAGFRGFSFWIRHGVTKFILISSKYSNEDLYPLHLSFLPVEQRYKRFFLLSHPRLHPETLGEAFLTVSLKR